MEDLSDRELERYLQENNAAQCFCEFGLNEPTPDYTVFTKIRARLGTSLFSKIFNDLRDKLKQQGVMNEVFSFVDTSHLIANLWQKRDKAIKEKYDKLNNEVLPKLAVDKQARIGCKGKDKFWYGYKQHVSVDMQSGLINKMAITPANETDAKGLDHIYPSQGGIYADKAYYIPPAKRRLPKGAVLEVIKINNMKDINKDKEAWYTKLRAPYNAYLLSRISGCVIVGSLKINLRALCKPFVLI